MQRQWIGLSLTGDQASVELLPSPPHPSAPSFIGAVDIEVGFLRKGLDVAEVFNADDMARNFVKAFSGIVMSANEVIVFEFHGQNLKGTIKNVSVLELADEQRKGASAGSRPSTHGGMGILFEKTDVTFMKAADSPIKIKSSAKK